MEKVKRFPWLYLVIYNRCPSAVYSTAWRALAHILVLYREGFNDLNLFKVIRYRVSRDETSRSTSEVSSRETR